ncbi:MAG: hypothetical protein DI626_04515 [Micavibrio aeruginosavorus]|uniref:Pilus assembly protein CpaD n=1 Tax=Micavibrio aeruginosavorus TaxID=349221 RepID=A0A2W5BVU5_9BACT|nr:MAG: hypothetical protein DI626_04515 [Micavibrio aeruginosavorus]
MTKKVYVLAVLAGASVMLGACARQSTPSMMNTSMPRVVEQTSMQQVPVSKISDGYLAQLADDYGRYGSGAVTLALAYDPSSKTYGAMDAFNDLASIKERLRKAGLKNARAETVKMAGTEPTLFISYDSQTAMAPAGCRSMPGFDDGLTTAEIGNYKFGCSVDSMIAQQIYRPADLRGNAGSEPLDGRKAANVAEYNRRVDPERIQGELSRMERKDIQAE